MPHTTSAADLSSFTPPDLAQSRLYRHVLHLLGREVVALDLADAGRANILIRPAGPLGHIALIPGGVQWRADSTIATRRRALAGLPGKLRARGVGALLCNAATRVEDDMLTAQGHLPLISGGYSAQWDLTGSAATRRARLKQKWRNRLVKSERGGLSIRHDQFAPQNHRWLLTAEARQRQRRSYRALPLAFTETLARFAPEHTRLFIAARGDEPLAAMLFLLHDGAATYHIGHLSNAGRALSAHNLLLWQAANWLSDQGIRRLDLGPVETESQAGLARFKLGCGAQPVRRGASFLHMRATAPLGRLVRRLTGQPNSFSCCNRANRSVMPLR